MGTRAIADGDMHIYTEDAKRFKTTNLYVLL